MCGICGVVNGPGAKNPVEEGVLRQMCAVLRHRGPDDEGVWTDGVAGLGQSRLAIIDLSPAGHQPMSNETGRVWITFNGEIYNFPELRSTLEKQGHRFRSRTDTETVVHLYEEKDTDVVQHLRGMFAFALWDADRQRLFLARDRLGQKPLYYGVFDGVFYFASEIKAILAVPGVPRRVNWQAIDHYLTYRYVPGTMTAFEGIHKLAPAHYLIWERGGLRVARYWDLAFTPKLSLSLPEAEEQLLALLDEAVRIRLISDVPLGAFLSGGVDSSSVVALMSQHSDRVRTFSIGFRELDMSELPYARQVAERFGTEHEEFVVEARALEVLPRIVWHYDEPFADPSAIPTHYLSQMTRQSVTVALSGDGGDEGLGGYERYQPQYHYSPVDWIPTTIRRPLLTWTAQRMPVHYDQRSLTWKLRNHLPGAAGPPPAWYWRTLRTFTQDLKGLLYGPQMRQAVHVDAQAWYWDVYAEVEALPRIERAMRADLFTYLPDAMLVKVDVASMINSLEVRSPFLDHRVVEFTARLPLAYKMRGREGKYVLKKVMERCLPREILYRRKKGFSVPLARWLRGDMREFVEEVLFAGDDLPYFDPAAVRQFVAAYMEGRGDYATHLWTMVNLYLWHRMFIERSISPPIP